MFKTKTKVTFELPLEVKEVISNVSEEDASVNHPGHYNTGKIEVIDAIEDWGLGFNDGNVIKYVARAKHKENEIQDLKKALWYLKRQIKTLEGK